MRRLDRERGAGCRADSLCGYRSHAFACNQNENTVTTKSR